MILWEKIHYKMKKKFSQLKVINKIISVKNDIKKSEEEDRTKMEIKVDHKVEQDLEMAKNMNNLNDPQINEENIHLSESNKQF